MTTIASVVLGVVALTLAVATIKFARRRDRPWGEWRFRYLYAFLLATILVHVPFGLAENLTDVTYVGKTLIGIPLAAFDIASLFIFFTGLRAKAAKARVERQGR